MLGPRMGNLQEQLQQHRCLGQRLLDLFLLPLEPITYLVLVLLLMIAKAAKERQARAKARISKVAKVSRLASHYRAVLTVALDP